MDVFEWLKQPVTLILVLGVVIVFHELGHFLAARMFDVKVEIFSFGFGPRLFGWRRGETDYRVCLIPLGGYVRMAGDNASDDEDMPRAKSPRDFDAKPTVPKLLIMVAGPVFNFILAIVLLMGAYMGGVEVAAYLHEAPRVGQVEEDSPAARGGIEPGDLVLAVNGRSVDRWEVLLEQILVNPGAKAVVDVERAGQRLSLPVEIGSRTKHAIGWLGILPCSRISIHSVTDDGAANAAGLRPGDEIVSVDGETPCSLQGLVARIQDAKGAPQALVVTRGAETLTVSVAARFEEPAGRWRLGLSPQQVTVIQRFAPFPALRESLATNWRQTGLLVDTLGRLFTGRLSMRTMSGPMELAEITEDAADTGLASVVSLMALISLNLGIFNLLPIPILDGGRIFILLAEAVRGRELERRTKEWILTAGVAMIVLLMVMVLWFDVIKKLEG